MPPPGRVKIQGELRGPQPPATSKDKQEGQIPICSKYTAQEESRHGGQLVGVMKLGVMELGVMEQGVMEQGVMKQGVRGICHVTVY